MIWETGIQKATDWVTVKGRKWVIWSGMETAPSVVDACGSLHMQCPEWLVYIWCMCLRLCIPLHADSAGCSFLHSPSISQGRNWHKQTWNLPDYALISKKHNRTAYLYILLYFLEVFYNQIVHCQDLLLLSFPYNFKNLHRKNFSHTI